MNLSRSLRIVFLLLALCGTVGCDQATKHLARKTLDPFDSITLMGGLGELRLAENPGAFLSLGAALPKAVRTWAFTLVTGGGLLGLLAYLVLRPPSHWLAFAGLTLILAGGLSNLIDRLARQGSVTDFITLRWGSLQTGVFNIADVTVMFGLVLLVLAHRKRRTHTVSAPKTNQ